MIGKTHFLYYVLAWLPVDFPDLSGIALNGYAIYSPIHFTQKIKGIEMDYQ